MVATRAAPAIYGLGGRNAQARVGCGQEAAAAWYRPRRHTSTGILMRSPRVADCVTLSPLRVTRHPHALLSQSASSPSHRLSFTRVPAMRTLLALLLALLVPLVHSRPLTVEPRSDFSTIWTTFTLNASTLFLGPQLLASTSTTSDAGCAELCSQTAGCTWFAWCPDWGFTPCDTLAYCGTATASATAQSLQPGTCLLSNETVAGRVAGSNAKGSAVSWSSGYLIPPPAPPAALPPAAAPEPAAGPSVWDTFTRYPNTLYRGPDVLAWGAAGSEGECATACSQQQGCQQWTWCPTDAGDSGCEALELCSPGSASAAGTWAPPGTCILSTDLQMSAGRLAYLFMSGPTVAWSGGYLDPKAAAPPSPPSASGSSVGGGSGGCPAGFIDCGQGCIDVLNNAQNCGGCGQMCGAGRGCALGQCSCDLGLTPCGGVCTSIMTDPYNCGMCGWQCSWGQQCWSGSCS